MKNTAKNTLPENGAAVDSQGRRAVDPTKNVTELVEAAMLRQDDLRNAESRRNDELRAAESRRVDEQAQLRADFGDKLAAAETKRIDAIRAVDVNAVAVANQKSTDQATVLANQVAQSAETLRQLVATTAATAATAFTQATTAIMDRLTKLEQAQYEGKGKQAVTDPAMEKLIQEVGKLTLTVAGTVERRSGSTSVIPWVISGVAVFVTVVTFAILLVKTLA